MKGKEIITRPGKKILKVSKLPLSLLNVFIFVSDLELQSSCRVSDYCVAA